MADYTEPTKPKVTGSPERIWLQYGDIEDDCTHDECDRDGDISWCDHAVFDSDVGYVRADALEAQAREIEALRRQIDSERADAVAGHARFSRLYGIARRVRWTEFGVPAIAEDAGSKQALEDLAEFLFNDGIDTAMSAEKGVAS